MARFKVTVWTDYEFEVEAGTKEEAVSRATEAAELHHGVFYDWQVDEEDIELVEDEEGSPSW